MTFDDIWQHLVRQQPTIGQQDPETVAVFRDFYQLGVLAGRAEATTAAASTADLLRELYKRRGK